MDEITGKYIETIIEKLDLAKTTRMTGNIVFQVNTKDGGIGNMTISVTQSYKHDTNYHGNS